MKQDIFKITFLEQLPDESPKYLAENQDKSISIEFYPPKQFIARYFKEIDRLYILGHLDEDESLIIDGANPDQDLNW